MGLTIKSNVTNVWAQGPLQPNANRSQPYFKWTFQKKNSFQYSIFPFLVRRICSIALCYRCTVFLPETECTHKRLPPKNSQPRLIMGVRNGCGDFFFFFFFFSRIRPSYASRSGLKSQVLPRNQDRFQSLTISNLSHAQGIQAHSDIQASIREFSICDFLGRGMQPPSLLPSSPPPHPILR